MFSVLSENITKQLSGGSFRRRFEMKKKIISLFTVISMLLLIIGIPIANAENDHVELMVSNGTCGDGLTWTLDSSGMLIVSGTGDMSSWSSTIDVPWNRSDIKHVVVEEGITSIGQYAFYGCENLTEVIIPDM